MNFSVLKSVLAVVAVVSAMVAVFVAQISPSKMTESLIGQFGRVSGLVITPQAQAKARLLVHLLPWPSVEIIDLEAEVPAENFRISGGSIRANLRFLPTLVGRIEFYSLNFTDAHIDWTAPDASKPFSSPQMQRLPVYAINLARSSITIHNIGVADIELEQLNAHLGLPGSNRPLSLEARFQWDGTAATLTGSLDEPQKWLQREKSALAATLTLGKSSLKVSGAAQINNGFSFMGRLNADVTEFNPVLTALGHPPARLAQIQLTNFDSTLKIDQSAAMLTNVTANVNGVKVEGNLSLLGGSHPRLSTTLAADYLELGAADLLGWRKDLAARAANLQSGGVFTELPCDIDLRASFGKAKIAGISGENLAISLRSKPEYLEISIDDAKIYEGVAHGFFTLSKTRNILTVHHKYTLAGLDLALAAAEHPALKQITGTLSASVELLGHEFDGAVPFSGSNGNGVFLLENAVWSGGDLAKWLDQNTPPSTIPPGFTQITKANGALMITGGTMQLDRATLAARNFSAQLAGSLNLPGHFFDLQLIGRFPLPRANTTPLPYDSNATSITRNWRGNW